MRIICPNCMAAYEIPANAVPAQGREVQCSTCTHSWYQLPPAKDEKAPEPSAPDRPASNAMATDASPQADVPAGEAPERPDPDVAETSKPPPAFGREDDETPEQAEDEETGFIFANKPRRKLDPEVLEVLRAEAIFEARARQKANTASFETQPDLGLPPPVRPRPGVGTASIRDRLARLQEAEKNPRARTWEAGEETMEGAGGDRPAPEPRTVSRSADAVVSARREDAERDAVPRDAADQRLWRETSHRSSRKAAPKGPIENRSPQESSPHLRGLRRSRPAEAREAVPPKVQEAAPEVADKSVASTTRRELQRVTPAGLPVRLSPRDLALIVEEQQRRGFRWGFGLTCGLACGVVALYLLAPTILQALPQTGPLVDMIISRGEGVQSALADMVRQLIGG